MKTFVFAAIASGLALFSACARNPSGIESEIAKELATELVRLNAIPHDGFSAVDAVPAEISQFCGDCHKLPQPSSFVREIWYDEIEKGYEFYARSGRTDLTPPPLQSVLAFYREHAPAKLNFPQPAEVDKELRSRFELEQVDWQDGPRLSPAISCIRWVDFQPEGEGRLIITDMRDGSISMVTPSPKQTKRRLIGRVSNPARVIACDLNQDQRTDLVVSDLGSFNPYDHGFGKVVWLNRESSASEFRLTTLVENLGRVADVAVADFSGDLKPDLLIAEFGHRLTGGTRLLTNETADKQPMRFQEKPILIRPGTMQVSAHDWNQDGAMDFASITSQEFECVDVFVHSGDKFDAVRTWQGGDVTFGLVGFELTDLDQDGDQDILCVNGDSFDNNFANRSHGVQWLENIGDVQFRYHRLAEVPGAYRAVAVDIDGDNDLDVIVVVNLPTDVYPRSLLEMNPVSLLMLEQVAPGNFSPRVLERGTPRYAALEAADFNGDGKVDLAVGAQLFDTDPPGSAASKLPRLTLWWQK